MTYGFVRQKRSARAQIKRDAFEEAMGTPSTDTRILWAVAAEEWDPKARAWTLEVRYNHAETEHLARYTYTVARKFPFRIISVGRVIGYHVNDNQGIKLSA